MLQRLTPSSRTILEKLTVVHLVKKFPAIYIETLKVHNEYKMKHEELGGTCSTQRIRVEIGKPEERRPKQSWEDCI
jgi:hypothetical protein